MVRKATFAERLKYAIDMNHTTKAELARNTGISKSSLTRYTKGDWEGKQDAVYALSKALNVNEAWLMGYDVPMARRMSSIETDKTDDRDIIEDSDSCSSIIFGDEPDNSHFEEQSHKLFIPEDSPCISVSVSGRMKFKISLGGATPEIEDKIADLLEVAVHVPYDRIDMAKSILEIIVEK